MKARAWRSRGCFVSRLCEWVIGAMKFYRAEAPRLADQNAAGSCGSIELEELAPMSIYCQDRASALSICALIVVPLQLRRGHAPGSSGLHPVSGGRSGTGVVFVASSWNGNLCHPGTGSVTWLQPQKGLHPATQTLEYILGERIVVSYSVLQLAKIVRVAGL